jgi:hypothetical protein
MSTAHSRRHSASRRALEQARRGAGKDSKGATNTSRPAAIFAIRSSERTAVYWPCGRVRGGAGNVPLFAIAFLIASAV